MNLTIKLTTPEGSIFVNADKIQTYGACKDNLKEKTFINFGQEDILLVIETPNEVYAAIEQAKLDAFDKLSRKMAEGFRQQNIYR